MITCNFHNCFLDEGTFPVCGTYHLVVNAQQVKVHDYNTAYLVSRSASQLTFNALQTDANQLDRNSRLEDGQLIREEGRRGEVDRLRLNGCAEQYLVAQSFDKLLARPRQKSSRLLLIRANTDMDSMCIHICRTKVQHISRITSYLIYN